MKRLQEQDRKFFGRVAEAAYANPFGTAREELDAELAELAVDDPDVLERLHSRLALRLRELAPQGHARLEHYAGADRELLQAAVSFDVFHRYLAEIDALIELDERSEGPARVRFAKGLLADLAAHGLSASDSVRMLELFYQIRRAHVAVRTRLVGVGPSMRRVREELWNALFTRDIRTYDRFLWSRMEDFSTLLVGETGSGKGEAAHALGRSAFIAFDEKRESFRERAADMFMPVHLSEFPETLIESELFGHRKGAFTGAIDHHEGALARVKAHGMLFLDEIGEISLTVQVKLLRVLQERGFTPVGGHAPERFVGRVVAATHRSFDELRRDGRMRDDFFYRLCTNTIALPSLSTRIAENAGELERLVDHLCTRIIGEQARELSARVHSVVVRDLGASYSFPGNVRELEQCVRRVLLTGSCRKTQTASTRAEPLAELVDRGELTAEELLSRYCASLYARTKSYVEVARVTGLDRRTVKRHVANASEG